MKQQTAILQMDYAQLQQLLKRVEESSLAEEDTELVKALALSFLKIYAAYHSKKAAVGRLLKQLFGAKTEKKKRGARAKNRGGSDKKKDKPTGHGRNGADQYTGADRKAVAHEQLTSGDPCPECGHGLLHKMKKPSPLLVLTGSMPVGATIFELEKLRCSGCGKVFIAQAPPEAGSRKYDESVATAIALLKYGSGMPIYRLAKLQKHIGIPLPESTQWELVQTLADPMDPVQKAMQRLAANGRLIHNDDTGAQILQRTKELKEAKKEGLKPERTGTYSTAILSETEYGRIALYFTGSQHAGENLEQLLTKHRDMGSSPPLQMCDALSRNIPASFKGILCNCLAHCRRKYYDLLDIFPKETEQVIEWLGKVYHHDAIAKEQQLDDLQRLAYHQEHSSPIMDNLKSWITEQIDSKQVEPNSELGKAFRYTQNHWKALTQFLKTAGAPIDNSICEQVVKRFVLFRKSSLFYKTRNGAGVGDLFMSFIHTCELNKVNPFSYLLALAKHPRESAKDPEEWMPWNYEQALERIV
jgi:transposase